ncbi:hypothetical protein SAMN04487891_112143 [Flagellimonas taeanensis]|jgi:hypothetical protein|uniref:Uncharacterized protein n=1 Tax=Flagellimonas taeanensis TaxID=1005926 RepID=A0A1M7C046_9FLAO|nr:hypothetical protein SAMN04487891_112143 [Allomuricauda taeanensis]SHL60564.1 hypothetical protein SAMN05216293_3887 [Allomuricauda taeanensis]
MNNLTRSLLIILFLGGMLFCYRDESLKVTWKDDYKTNLHEQAFNERTLLGIGQKRILRLKQSANDDRNL